MVAAPAWAEQLVARVCADNGVPLIPLTWRQSTTKSLGTGRHIAPPGRIVITCASQARIDADHSATGGASALIDARNCLLHELAHHIRHVRYPPAPRARFARKRRRQVHDRVFWGIAWPLFQRYGDVAAALHREVRYIEGAMNIALGMGVPGAGAAFRKLEEEKYTRRSVTRAVASKLPAGTAVRLHSVSPKYLDGATGVIEKAGTATAIVRLDSILFRGRYRTIRAGWHQIKAA